MLTMHWGSQPLPDQPLNTRLALRDWAFSIEPGSGLPFILLDDSWEILATRPPDHGHRSPGRSTSMATTWRLDGSTLPDAGGTSC
jgi:hypothetical protein